MGSWGIEIKQSDYGLDLLMELVREQLAPDGFQIFNVPLALKTLRAFCKEALATTYAPGNRLNHLWGHYHSDMLSATKDLLERANKELDFCLSQKPREQSASEEKEQDDMCI